MTGRLDVVAAALTLSRDERADLAHKRIVSLDGPFDDPEDDGTRSRSPALAAGA